MAGPVVDQCCLMTNLGWEVNGPALKEKFEYEVAVLNDFEAVGYGVRHVDAKSLVRPAPIIFPGTSVQRLPILFVGVAKPVSLRL